MTKTKSVLESDINNLKNDISESFSSVSNTVTKFYDYLKSKNLDFFIKWIFVVIIIGIYVTCLVLFLNVNQNDKAKSILEWYSFLFRVWYFVPVLTLTFICLLLVIFTMKMSVLSYILLSLVLIFFTLSIYYSYNTLYYYSKNRPLIMYSITLFFILLLWISLTRTNDTFRVTILHLPLIVMVVFGVYLGINYVDQNLDNLLLTSSTNYAIEVKRF
jgi:hypothetical protein